MNNEEPPIVTSVTVTDHGPRPPVIISTEENATEIAIRDALLAEPRLGGADLFIRRKGDHIVISGTVQTDEQRIIAMDIAAHFVESGYLVDEIQTEVTDQSPDFCEA